MSGDTLAGRIAGVFAQVLGREVRVDESLFGDLDATSLQVARITARLRRDVDDRLRVADVFERPVATALAQALVGSPSPVATREATTVGDRPAGAPMLPGPLWYRAFHPGDPTPFTVDAVLLAADPVDAAVLERALVAVLRRHESLRGSRPEVVEVRATPSAPAEPSVAKVIADLRGRLDAGGGDVLRLARVTHRNQEYLVLVVHHLACDAASLRIILADLERVYHAGGVDTAPPVIGAHAWAHRLAAYLSSPESEPERAYWLALPPVPASPLRRVPPGSQTANEGTDELLAADRAERLRRLAADRGLTVGEAVLACVGLALGRRTGAEAVTVGVNHHGRSERFGDLTCARSVGWFSFNIPCRLSLGGGPEVPLADAVRSLVGQVRGIPRHGIGAAMWSVRGDSADPLVAACRRAAEEVLVTVNSTVDLVDDDRAAGRWQRLPLPCPPASVPRSRRVGVSCTAGPDGSFRFRWRWHPAYVDGEGMRWVVDQTRELLGTLADGS